MLIKALTVFPPRLESRNVSGGGGGGLRHGCFGQFHRVSACLHRVADRGCCVWRTVGDISRLSPLPVLHEAIVADETSEHIIKKNQSSSAHCFLIRKHVFLLVRFTMQDDYLNLMLGIWTTTKVMVMVSATAEKRLQVGPLMAKYYSFAQSTWKSLLFNTCEQGFIV